MNRRNIIIISLIILVILIIAIVFWWFLLRQPTPALITEEPAEETAQADQLPPPSQERLNDEASYPLGVKQLSLSFAERFASYSSDADFKNLRDLKPLVTAKMGAVIDDYISRTTLGQNGFEAVEAKALNSRLDYLAGDEALVVVSLQLNKFVGDKTDLETTYRQLRLKSIKIGEEWKIDEATWQ